MPARLLAALVMLAAGCGGSGPEEVVRDYFAAVVDRDGEKACAQLSDELRGEIERAPAARDAGRSCTDVMELAAGLNPSLKEEDVEDLAVEVEQNDDQAVARLKNPLVRRQQSIDLIKEDGGWKISTLENRPRS